MVNNFTTVDNIAKLKAFGLNLKLEHSWNDLISTKVNYLWLDQNAWNEATQNYDIAMNLFGEQQLTVGLAFDFGNWRWGVDEQIVRNRKQNGSEMPDYEVVRFKLSLQANQYLDLVFLINNLTDEAYQIQTGYPMPGREWKLSMNYNF